MFGNLLGKRQPSNAILRPQSSCRILQETWTIEVTGGCRSPKDSMQDAIEKLLESLLELTNPPPKAHNNPVEHSR